MDVLRLALFSLLVVAVAMGSETNDSGGMQEFLVETRVVINKQAYERWTSRTGKKCEKSLRKHIDSIFLEATQLFKGLEEKKISVRFSIVDFKIEKEKDVIAGGNILGLARAFADLQLDQYKGDNPLPGNKTADLTVLFNGIALGVHGIAKENTICKNLGTKHTANTIVDFTATWQDAFFLTHLVARVLGASDDYGDCHNGNYIMNVDTFKIIDSENGFRFSHCSKTDLKERLMGDGGSCLKDGDVTSAIGENNDKRLHVRVSPDETCRRLIGPASYVPRDSYWTYNHHVCHKLECRTEGFHSKFYIANPQGIACAKNKRCNLGKCEEVTNPLDRPQSDSCPFGDVKKIDHKNYTSCESLPKHECNGVLRFQCCKSCNTAKLNQPDEICRERLGPKSSFARFAYSGEQAYQVDNDVCVRLACTTGVTDTRRGTFSFQYVNGAAPDGMICGEYKVCKDSKCVHIPEDDTANHHLIKTTTTSDDCPFGDQAYSGYRSWETCAHLAAENPNRCHRSNSDRMRPKNVCCHSCNTV